MTTAWFITELDSDKVVTIRRRPPWWGWQRSLSGGSACKRLHGPPRPDLRRHGQAPINLNDDEDPARSDFACFSFDLGMTRRTFDTNGSTPPPAQGDPRPMMLSSLYGTLVVAAPVNLVAGFTS